MQIMEALVGIVGAEQVSDDPKELESSSKDHSLSPSRMPNYVVRPQTP